MTTTGIDQKEFFVWVNPDDWMVRHNIGIVGGIAQPPPSSGNANPEDLMFVFNPNHKQGDISRFHLGVIRNYLIEYDLERFRHARYPTAPSRLFALYLFETREEAQRYHSRHPEHVGKRILKRGLTAGPYIFSTHDSAWIDFLRLDLSIDADTSNACWEGYWSGRSAQDCTLEAWGKPWPPTSVMEVLFYGRVNFPNKDVTAPD